MRPLSSAAVSRRAPRCTRPGLSGPRLTGKIAHGGCGVDQAGRAVPAAVPDGASSQVVLRAALDSGPDGVVVVGPDGRMTAWNERFRSMWPIPEEVIASGSDDAALESVLDKLEDPQEFLRRVRELYAGAAGSDRTELRLLDGRIFDRHGSALHADDGRYLGWAWYFRDVTSERSAALAAGMMASLVAVAQALGEASSEQDVLQVVTGLGVATIGAQGAVLCLAATDDPVLRVLTTGYFDDQVRAEVAELPRDFPLPLVSAAVHGQALFLRDRQAALELFPAARELFERTSTDASAAVPLHFDHAAIGSLSVAFDRPYPWRDEDRRLLLALATLTAQALGRIAAQQAERTSALAVRRMAETLQRSLLTAPPAAADLQVAVRYQAAAQDAQVGGDWHDSFQRSDGILTLVIGDVAGHDRDAAALMAQCRNILRGVAQSLHQPPGAVLTGLDNALTALYVDVTATAVLCQVRRPADAAGAVLTWSNAGHLPPLLLHDGGPARLLTTEPDLLLGMNVGTGRADHQVHLTRGSTLLLYTDGLVERKGEHLDVGLARLTATVQDAGRCTPDELCDLLLDQLGPDADDDVALLVLHVP